MVPPNDTRSYDDICMAVYPQVKAVNHVHHAGNSSGVVDGASALLIASPEYAKAHGLKPRGRIVQTATAGSEPVIMLTAPAPATQMVLKKAGMRKEDIDLFEINEAFAVVAMAAMHDLGLPHDKVNVHGGACALGHPLGASGARIMVTLLAALEKYRFKRGIAALCIGGGEATAIALERLE